MFSSRARSATSAIIISPQRYKVLFNLIRIFGINAPEHLSRVRKTGLSGCQACILRVYVLCRINQEAVTFEYGGD